MINKTGLQVKKKKKAKKKASLKKGAIVKKKAAPKKRVEVKKKVGRPRFNVDFEAVRKLSSMHCTQEEIALFLGCSVDTLQRNEEFCGIYKKGMAEGKISLRRSLYKSSDDGNVTAQIWLSKQYLGMKDKQETTHHGIIGAVNLTDKSEEELKAIVRGEF